MKKTLALILALIMLFALAGCGSKKATTWEDQLGTQGKLRVAISPDYPPYEGYDAQGNVVGFDVEVAKYIANKIDKPKDLNNRSAGVHYHHFRHYRRYGGCRYLLLLLYR